MDWRRLAGQAGRFLLVSGTGWLMDFALFLALTKLAGVPVAFANMASSVPALSFVFFVSTRRIFRTSVKRVPLWGKYAIWFGYQMALVFCVSWAAQWLFNVFSASALGQMPLLAPHLELASKLCVTPFTMTANFFAMKVLSERI